MTSHKARVIFSTTTAYINLNACKKNLSRYLIQLSGKWGVFYRILPPEHTYSNEWGISGCDKCVNLVQAQGHSYEA